MKEVAFLRRNAEKWQQFEALLSARKGVDPDKLADLYISITDDLSYARTHYPKSRTTAYLNSLAARVHRQVYRRKKEDRGRLVRFWTHELPEVLGRHQRELLYSFVIFAIAIFIGAVSTSGDDSFVRLVLGDAYVNMTLSNIEQGDPMAVYKQMRAVDMFLVITVNNVLVSFYAFAMGLLFSIGTVYVLFNNGVMLGSFQYFFHQQDLLIESMLVVWIHGTLEICAIVVAGCAGLVMGNSILFPGTYSRRVSFMRGARKGLKIIIGLVPVFVFAGFLEGFVTRHTGMPLVLSITIILGSLAFAVWYFVLYPRTITRRFNGTIDGND